MTECAPDAGHEPILARIFACEDTVARKLGALCHLRKFPGATTILHQGDLGTDAHIVVLGQARAIVYSAEGGMIVAAEYGPGDVFGALETAAADEQEADVVAVAEVQSLVIEVSALAQVALQHGAVGFALSQMLMRRLREATTRLYERSALSAQGRVYAELRRLGNRSGQVISPAPVVTDLALRVGTTRETASRAISALERRGIIDRTEGTMRILAPQRLEELVY